MSTLIETWRQCFAPRDRRPIYDWAHDNISLAPTLSKSGKFSVATSRHFIGPFDALKNERVREVNVMAPPRSGKSLISDIFIPWCIAEDPASVLLVMQDEEMGGSHSELRLMPMLKSVRAVREKLPANVHKERNMEIVFADGLPLIVTGPALGKLQSRGFKILSIDEAWILAEKFPGRIEEAKSRLGDFIKQGNSKCLIVSQGGEVGEGEQGNDWHIQFQSGTIHEWQVQCAACSFYFQTDWTGTRSDGSRWGMVYDSIKDSHGRRSVRHAVESVRYVCPACGHAHEDLPKIKEAWNKTGRYQFDAAGNVARVSFHWNRVTEWPWGDMVEAWIKAQEAYDTGYNKPLIQFYQKHLAQCYDPSKADRIYKLPAVEITKPAGSKFWEKQDAIFLTVDVQQDHFWALVTSWSAGGEMMVLYFGQLFSWADVATKQKEFDIVDQCVLVDAGQGSRQAEIYAECAKHGHVEPNPHRWACWWALKGRDREGFPDETRTPDAQTGKHPIQPWSWPAQHGDPCSGLRSDNPLLAELRGKFCPVIQWSNPTVKGIAKRRRDAIASGDRSFIAKGDWNETFNEHLHSETEKVTVNKWGRDELKWCVIGRRPNHGWDCFCMAITAAGMAGVLGDLSAE